MAIQGLAFLDFLDNLVSLEFRDLVALLVLVGYPVFQGLLAFQGFLDSQEFPALAVFLALVVFPDFLELLAFPVFLAH